MFKIVLIVITVVVEIILGLLIVKNPNRFVGEGKPDLLMKIFIFIMISLMIIVLTYLTLSGIKG